MNVLSFTTIYPNAEQPLHGLFVRERIRALARICPLQVVAPVPWTPGAALVSERHRTYSRVPGREQQEHVTVYHPRFLTIPKVLKTFDGALMAGSCRTALRSARRHFAFDIVDAHWGVPDGVAAALLARAFDVPYAMTVRGDDVNVFGEQRGRGAALRWALRRASLVIALSTELGTKVERMGVARRRIAVIPNGIDPARFKPGDRTAARRRLNLDPDVPVVLSAGRLHASKGFPAIVDAVARLGSRHADVRIAIVGQDDGEAPAEAAIRAAAVRAGLEHRLILPGSQPPAALSDWYTAADVFCLPTSREGSANVLIEATACGLPCVTTPVGGNPDVITERNGILTPADADAMAAALARALERRWDRQAIADHMRRRTWDVVAAECHDALAQAVNESRRRAA
jgi:glycosyltransferase involved in cell wall biosynthesis